MRHTNYIIYGVDVRLRPLMFVVSMYCHTIRFVIVGDSFVV